MSRDRERLDEIAKRIRREINDAAIISNSESNNIVNSNSNISISNSNSNINSNNNSNMGRRAQSFGVPSSGTLNTITPCAACKLLRRRCAEECPFSPYFSPQEPHKFAAVHKVFGASNVSKMLLELPESQRGDAANSLVYEANLRLRDPVYGCMGLISALQQQIQTLQAELNAMGAEILRHKFREATNCHINNNNNNNVSHHHPNGSASVHAALLSPNHNHNHHQLHQHNLVSIASFPGASHGGSIPPPSTPPPAPPPPPPPLPPPSVVVSPSSTSSTSSLYTTPSTNTTGYSSISSDNVPGYFE